MRIDWHKVEIVTAIAVMTEKQLCILNAIAFVQLCKRNLRSDILLLSLHSSRQSLPLSGDGDFTPISANVHVHRYTWQHLIASGQMIATSELNNRHIAYSYMCIIIVKYTIAQLLIKCSEF